jgi:hypothetical protein
MLVSPALVSPVVLQAQEKCTTTTMHGSSSVVAAATNRAIDTTVTVATHSGNSSNLLVKQEVRPSWERSPASTSSCGSDASSLELSPLKGPSEEAVDDVARVVNSFQEDTPVVPATTNNASTTVPVSRPFSQSLPPPQRPRLTLRSSLRNSSSRSTDSGNWGKSSRDEDNGNRRGNVRRSVSFGDHEIYPIEHVNRINRRERSRRWFNSNDLAYQRSENDHLLELMERTGSFNEKTCLAKLTGEKNPAERYTIRGLERQTIQGKTQYYEHYRDAVMAVLVQQQRIITHKKKKKTKSADPTKPAPEQSESEGSSVDAMDVIASSYRKETVQAQQQAVSQGRHDAKEVRAYLAEQCDIESIRQLHERELRQKESSVIGFLRKPFKQRTNSAASLSSMLSSGSNHSVTKVEV